VSAFCATEMVDDFIAAGQNCGPCWPNSAGNESIFMQAPNLCKVSIPKSIAYLQGRPLITPKMLSSCFVVLLSCVRVVLPLLLQPSSQQRRTSRCAVHNVEQRLESFWEERPFTVAERVVLNVLTTGVLTSQLLCPICDNVLDDDLDHRPFYSLYNGSFSYMFSVSEELSVSFRKRRRKKQSFRFVLAYAGQYFCGWQRQPNNFNLPSVQEVVEDAIASAFIENGRPDVRVSGRTDAGVSALGQVARVRILVPKGDDGSVSAADQLWNVLSAAARFSNYTWRCLSVSEVSESFHPTFDSTSRSYVYALDAKALRLLLLSATNHALDEQILDSFVRILNSLFEELEGKELDYIAFSHGKVKTETTLCTLRHAHVRLCTEVNSDVLVLIFEITGDRFLRRMIRMLVGTSLFIALQILDSEASPSLVDLCHSKQRNSRFVKTAPPGGLIFLGAQFLDRQNSNFV
jgi:tRNA pseudouridine38-40 synthase